MRNNISVLLAIILFFGVASFQVSGKGSKTDSELGLSAQALAGQNCATIQSGLVKDSLGNTIGSGYDKFGYNYQAHMFNGTYDGSDRNLDGTYWGQTGDFVDDSLIMKWSNDWLANVDCNNDGMLDRGTDETSLGWLTNDVNGDYDSDGDGTQDAHYTYFAKIVWVGTGGLWGAYDVIEEVYNDPVGGDTGLYSKVGVPGFGLNDQWTTNP